MHSWLHTGGRGEGVTKSIWEKHRQTLKDSNAIYRHFVLHNCMKINAEDVFQPRD